MGMGVGQATDGITCAVVAQHMRMEWMLPASAPARHIREEGWMDDSSAVSDKGKTGKQRLRLSL